MPNGTPPRMVITVRAQPCKPGRRAQAWDVTVDGEPLCISRNDPFFDAARALLKEGADPNATLVMRHAGSQIDALTGKLGKVAKLTGPRRRQGKAKDRTLEGQSSFERFDAH